MRRGFVAHRRALKFLLALSIAGCAIGGGTLSGSVVDESGAGITKATVLLLAGGDRVVKYQTVVEDKTIVADRGQFQISGIEPGEYIVRGGFLNFRETPARVVIRDGQVSTMKIVLKLPNCDDPGMSCEPCIERLVGQNCEIKRPLALVRVDLALNCAVDLDTGQSHCDGLEQSDVKLESEDGGKLFLVLMNGARFCDGAEKRLRIDGFGQWDESCVITDQNNRANVQIAQPSVDPGATKVRLRVETMR